MKPCWLKCADEYCTVYSVIWLPVYWGVAYGPDEGMPSGAANTCRESVAVPEFWVVGLTLPLVSTACTVNVEIPGVFGFPTICPVAARRWSPAGSEPPTTDHL
jgi:hypothetical protein